MDAMLVFVRGYGQWHPLSAVLRRRNSTANTVQIDGQPVHALQRHSLEKGVHMLCRTITRSDLLGHLVPMMSSYDWAHSGITHLFHNIQVHAQSSAPIACAMLVSLHQLPSCTCASKGWKLEPVPRNHGTVPRMS